jgi:hypothetical protein
MGAALLLALLVLALATHGRFLYPAGYGLSLAAQVVEARNEEARLLEQNQRLQEVHDFLQTPAGRELAARAEVQALKPGERLIVLSEAARQSPAPPQTVATRVQDGLQRAGEVVVSHLRYAREVLQVWSGFGQGTPPPAPTSTPGDLPPSSAGQP